MFSFTVNECCFGNFDISFERTVINCFLCIDRRNIVLNFFAWFSSSYSIGERAMPSVS